MDSAENKKPFKIKDVTRDIKKAVVAASLEEIRSKVAEKFDKIELMPTIHLDSDGTEIDDEEYFRTLEPNTELIAVFPGEHWIDSTQYVTITTHPDNTDTTDAAAETARIKKLVGQLKSNLCNVSMMSDSDLDSLSNMDPNSLVDITGKEFIDQLKDAGRLGGDQMVVFPPIIVSMFFLLHEILFNLFSIIFHYSIFFHFGLVTRMNSNASNQIFNDVGFNFNGNHNSKSYYREYLKKT